MDVAQVANPMEFGVIGGILIALYKSLDFAKIMALKKRGVGDTRNGTPTLVCQQDPIHHQRIREIHQYTSKVGDLIASKELGCQWQDREEVRDYMELQRKLLDHTVMQIEAGKMVTVALNALTAELRLNRNGKNNSGRAGT